MKNFGIVLFYIGMLVIGLATISSIIYAIYEWANVLPFAKALWAGAVLWLKMLGVGLITIVIGGVFYVFGA